MNKKEFGLKDIRRIAEFAVDFGADVIRCGGEVSRAEDSIMRICSALGAERTNVFAINSYISVCVEDPFEESEMVSRRIKGRETDLGRLEYLNQLSRWICDGKMKISDAEQALDVECGEASVLFTYIASMLVCSVFTLFFGGGIREAIVAGIAAIVTVMLKRKLKKRFGNAVAFTFVSSFLCGSLGAFLVVLGVAIDYSMIAKGDIMLLVPGVSIVCAGRDLICGELLTGLLGFVETVLIAIALAAGFALPEILINIF